MGGSFRQMGLVTTASDNLLVKSTATISIAVAQKSTGGSVFDHATPKEPPFTVVSLSRIYLSGN